MTAIPNLNDFIPFKVRTQLAVCVRATMASLEHENTLMAQAPISNFQRLLKVYKGLKPVLMFLTTFRLVPTTVRTGIGLLVQTLEAVSESGPELTAQFKAGKDLTEVQ